MTKFHDEFFKKRNPIHDELVLKCIAPNNKLKIVEAVENAFSETLLPPAVGAEYMPHKIWICNAPHCNKKDVACREEDRVCAVTQQNYLNNTWHWEPKCTEFNKEKASQVPEMRSCELKPQMVLVEAPLIVQTATPKRDSISYESEVICKSENGFIIGYADLLFTVFGEYSFYADLSKVRAGRQWNNFISRTTSETRILVEVKPEIKEFGSVLRQLKTYMKTLRVSFGVIVTYSTIRPEVIELLKREKIVVVTFEDIAVTEEYLL